MSLRLCLLGGSVLKFMFTPGTISAPEILCCLHEEQSTPHGEDQPPEEDREPIVCVRGDESVIPYTVCDKTNASVGKEHVLIGDHLDSRSADDRFSVSRSSFADSSFSTRFPPGHVDPECHKQHPNLNAKGDHPTCGIDDGQNAQLIGKLEVLVNRTSSKPLSERGGGRRHLRQVGHEG